ncbi:TIGR00180 family glycosyltransferase [Omnitrophica bacterium]|nr:TIGR00180 family glycosyltransferase [Candidatus Omnitrophota bacterium]
MKKKPLVNVVIPTYNRPYYLRRVLDYYGKYGQNYNIIVADSSSDENKKVNRKIISSFSNLNILYKDGYPSKINPGIKIVDAIKDANEEYCVFCADDDFVIPNGINKCVDFLKRNPDFTVAHGCYIGFRLKKSKRKKEEFYWTPGYSYQSVTFPDARSRLIFHFSNYCPTFYAVHRTDFLRMILKETAKFTNDTLFYEFLPSMLSLIYGKMKRLDVLYAARETMPVFKRKRRDFMRVFIKAGTYDEKYARFKDCLSTHLGREARLTIEDSREAVDSGMSAYLSRYITGKSRNVLVGKIKKVVDYLGLPHWIDSGIKRLYRRLFLPKEARKAVLRSSSDAHFKDNGAFNEICLHVLSFSKEQWKNKRNLKMRKRLPGGIR